VAHCLGAVAIIDSVFLLLPYLLIYVVKVKTAVKTPGPKTMAVAIIDSVFFTFTLPLNICGKSKNGCEPDPDMRPQPLLY